MPRRARRARRGFGPRRRPPSCAARATHEPTGRPRRRAADRDLPLPAPGGRATGRTSGTRSGSTTGLGSLPTRDQASPGSWRTQTAARAPRSNTPCGGLRGAPCSRDERRHREWTTREGLSRPHERGSVPELSPDLRGARRRTSSGCGSNGRAARASSVSRCSATAGSFGRAVRPTRSGSWRLASRPPRSTRSDLSRHRRAQQPHRRAAAQRGGATSVRPARSSSSRPRCSDAAITKPVEAVFAFRPPRRPAQNRHHRQQWQKPTQRHARRDRQSPTHLERAEDRGMGSRAATDRAHRGVAGTKPTPRALTLLGRLIATAAALVAVVAAVALAGYGVLLWIAIPSSDTATSSLPRRSRTRCGRSRARAARLVAPALGTPLRPAAQAGGRVASARTARLETSPRRLACGRSRSPYWTYASRSRRSRARLACVLAVVGMVDTDFQDMGLRALEVDRDERFAPPKVEHVTVQPSRDATWARSLSWKKAATVSDVASAGSARSNRVL